MPSKLFRLMSDPDYRFLWLAIRGFYDTMPDEEYLKRMYHAKTGYDLDLETPQTFNEKLQWLKLHDHNPLYTTMADKYEVKNYVGDIIGEEYIIPTLGVWDSFDDIEFSKLPEKFVLKCTHDSGGIVICKEKKKLDIETAKHKIDKCLKTNYYLKWREWPYKNVPPRVIAEEYIAEESSDGLTDYKIHCFNGVPKIILVCKDRFGKEGLSEDFFDLSWKHLDVRRPNARQCLTPLERPAELDRMLEIAEIFSKDIPFLRVDFYIIRKKIMFGEFTFFPASGIKPFIPESFDLELGKMMNIKDR